jgi:hypothetical protein
LAVDTPAAFDHEPVGLGNAPQNLLLVPPQSVRENWPLGCSGSAIVG